MGPVRHDLSYCASTGLARFSVHFRHVEATSTMQASDVNCIIATKAK